MRNLNDFKILNIGCGSAKLNHAWNIDADGSHHPDDIVDVTRGFNYRDGMFETVLMFHTIEHIQKKNHEFVLREIHRVLAPQGALFISYPEFARCALNYINNFQGRREFWEATVYGRQLTVWDAHVALIDTPIFTEVLLKVGFEVVSLAFEAGEPWNTHLQLEKVEPQRSYEDVLRKEIFHGDG